MARSLSPLYENLSTVQRSIIRKAVTSEVAPDRRNKTVSRLARKYGVSRATIHRIAFELIR